MIDELKIISSVLQKDNYYEFVVESFDVACIGFENDLNLGFVYCYETTDNLLKNWKSNSDQLLSKYQFQLRSAGEKSWNVYSVFLSFGASGSEENTLLAQVEENLSGTRKIARAVDPDLNGIRSGLLPLLQIQNPPILGPIDMVEEIKTRSSSLPQKGVEAFLAGAPNNEILRLMGRSDEA